jgi:glycosyltransferase involved in cell wall biosynthesis
MQTVPLVSVILPAYNAEQTIIRALRSVAAQTFTRLEIIVVDDASSDSTADLVCAWSDAPVLLKRLNKRSGAAAARNLGIALASGEYVAFLDADDEWLPEKTAAQLAVLTADPNLSFVTCEAWQVGADGTIEGLVNPHRARATGPEAWKTLLHHPCVATPCVILRRDLALGGFDTRLPVAEDQDFWIRLALMGPVAHLMRELVRVYDRPNSLSKNRIYDHATTTLPMILGHLTANRHRLTAREVREIKATRYTALGRGAYVGGHLGRGLLLLLKAVALGHQPLQNLAYLLFSSPPARWAKRLLRFQPPAKLKS